MFAILNTSGILLAGLLSLWVCAVHGHGRLRVPPSRSSMWRDGYNTPPNYDDHQLFCGGFQHQLKLGYKCGICGDPYDAQSPRDNEAGGKYGNGIITGTYTSGGTMDVSIEMTTNHRGWFEFRLCPKNDINKVATQECLNQYMLPDRGISRVTIPLNSTDSGFYNYNLQLPWGVTCTQCVLQWRYHAGNNWGTAPDGSSCIGCGPQEEFYGCADIAIVENASGI